MNLINFAKSTFSSLFGIKANKLTLVKLYLINLLLLLTANAAYAGPLDGIAIDVPDTDLSIQYLKSIFGTFGPLDGAEEKTVLGAIMMIWNASALLIGAIIVGYTVFAGVLKTAHEGEFLGRQWSSIWVPFRSSIAMSMILPLATGYSLIQGAGMWAVTQGIGIANMVNESALVYINENGGGITTPQPANGMTMVANLYKQLVCVESLNPILQAENATRTNGEPMLTMQRYASDVQSLHTNGYTYGFEGNEDACGGMSWNGFDDARAALEIVSANGMTVGNMISNIDLASTRTRIRDAQFAAIDSVAQEMQLYIRGMLDVNDPVRGGVEPSYDQFTGWVKQYNSYMAQEVSRTMATVVNEQGNMDVIRDAINKDGWASTGSYFIKVTHINDILSNLVDAQASDISMDTNLPEDYLEQVDSNLIKANQYIHKIAKTKQTGLAAVYNAQTGLTPEADELKDAQSSLSVAFTTAEPEFFETSNVLPYITNLFQSMGSGIISLLQKDENPITRIQNIGNMILNVKGTFDIIEYSPNIISKIGKKGAAIADAATSAKKESGALTNMSALVGTSSSMLFVAGIGMAVIVPMIPYIIWTLGVLSWLTSVLIAMVATPLWAISHATPGGDDAMGQGSNGYILLMSITLRPVLMLFGFYGAMLVLFAIDKLLTQSFITSFITMNSNSMNGPYVMTAAVLMYGVLSLIVVTTSFKLIYTIPNAILNWVGGKDDDVTDVGGGTNENRTMIYTATSNFKQVGHAAKSLGSKVVTRGIT